MSGGSGSVQNVQYVEGGNSYSSCNCRDFQIRTCPAVHIKHNSQTPGLEMLAGRLARCAEAQPSATWLHYSSIPPNCTGPAEQKPFPSVCFSGSVWRRLEAREVVSNRARKEGLLFYHRHVSLIWLVCFYVFFLASSLQSCPINMNMKLSDISFKPGGSEWLLNYVLKLIN